MKAARAGSTAGATGPAGWRSSAPAPSSRLTAAFPAPLWSAIRGWSGGIGSAGWAGSSGAACRRSGSAVRAELACGGAMARRSSDGPASRSRPFGQTMGHPPQPGSTGPPL